MRAGWRGVQEFPHGHCTLLNVLDEYLRPPELIILRGDESETGPWAATLTAAYQPRRMVFAIPRTANALPAALAAKAARPGATLAYVCRGTVCDSPVDSLEALTARSFVTGV